MNLEDQYKLLVESYYGVEIVDEYELKEYILKEIETLITNFKIEYNIDEDLKIREYIKDNVSIKTKLQSSLITLKQINAPLELILIIKNKLKNLQK